MDWGFKLIENFNGVSCIFKENAELISNDSSTTSEIPRYTQNSEMKSLY